MSAATYRCPEQDPIKRAGLYTVARLGDEPHAADCPRRGMRPAPSPAAEPPEGQGCTGCVGTCDCDGPLMTEAEAVLYGAAFLAQEELREDVARWLAQNYGEHPVRNMIPWRTEADALLAGPLAPLLAQAATDRAAVQRCEEMVHELIQAGAFSAADDIRRALSGDAR